MIVAHADERTGFLCGGFDFIKLSNVDRTGFFDEDMLALFDRCEGDGREGRIERGNKNHLHLGIGYGGLEICDRATVLGELHQFLGAG